MLTDTFTNSIDPEQESLTYMDTSKHTLTSLFEQLGMPSDQASIDSFIGQHSPLPAEIALQDAPFWSDSQSSFLEEGLEEDSDWAEVIDELDALMRH
jgi:hypothetical protein